MLAAAAASSSSCLQKLGGGGAFAVTSSQHHHYHHRYHHRTLFPPLSSSSSSSPQCRCHCSLTGFRELSTKQPRTFQNDAVHLPNTQTNNLNNDNDKESKNDDTIPEKEAREEDDKEDEEGNGISKIRVPRQKYIPVSKSDLLSGILSNMFATSSVVDQDDDEVKHFLLLSS